MPKIIILNKDETEVIKEIDLNPAISLFNNLGSHDVAVETQCGGRGNCGLCRVKIIEAQGPLSPLKKAEKVLISEENRVNKWRLSCQTTSLRDIKIRLPDYENEEARPETRKFGNPGAN